MKKLTYWQAFEQLQQMGVDFKSCPYGQKKDFFGELYRIGRACGYRQPKNQIEAGWEYGRSFFYFLKYRFSEHIN